MLTSTLVSYPGTVGSSDSYVYKKPSKVRQFQSGPLPIPEEPKEPIDVLFREVESPAGALPSVRAAMGIKTGVTLKKKKLSRYEYSLPAFCLGVLSVLLNLLFH